MWEVGKRQYTFAPEYGDFGIARREPLTNVLGHDGWSNANASHPSAEVLCARQNDRSCALRTAVLPYKYGIECDALRACLEGTIFTTTFLVCRAPKPMTDLICDAIAVVEDIVLTANCLYLLHLAKSLINDDRPYNHFTVSWVSTNKFYHMSQQALPQSLCAIAVHF